MTASKELKYEVEVAEEERRDVWGRQRGRNIVVGLELAKPSLPGLTDNKGSRHDSVGRSCRELHRDLKLHGYDTRAVARRYPSGATEVAKEECAIETVGCALWLE